MKHLRRLFIFAAILCLPVVFFSLYTHFLLDYSLDSLEFALQMTHRKPEEVSTLGRKVYHSVVKDLILEEAFAENVNYENLALLELTARSFNESLGRQGYKNAELYLNEIVKNKLPGRHPILRFLDFLYLRFLDLHRSFSSFMEYQNARKAAKKQAASPALEYSGSLLLTQAQASEEKKDLAKALELYREYLKFYPKSPDRGFVQVSISQILIQQKRFYEAENLLEDVQNNFKGQHEAEISQRLLRKIEILRKRQKWAKELERLLLKPESRNDLESEFLDLKLKLGISYFSLYEFERSKEIFEALSKSREARIRQKAQFYLAWLYKQNADFNQGEKVILGLLKDPLLDEQMNLGLHAGLADIYYQQKDIPKALAQYEDLSQKIQKKSLNHRAIYEAWAALAELEQAMIYFYDFSSLEETQKHLNLAKLFTFALSDFDFETMLKTHENMSLRDYAFSLLFQRKVTLAFEVFKKHLERHPEDAWAHSGIATVHMLMGDMNEARRSAQKGYKLKGDEYTASVLAYLYSLRQKDKTALILYTKAVRWNPEYLIARFNLGCVYLKLERFETAIQAFEKIDRALPLHRYMRAKVFNNMGYAYWGLGRQDKAVEKFKEALALSAKSQTAKDNLEQLQ